jgi:hypothetical protein
MIQSEKCGHSARPERVTEGDKHQPEADTISPTGGDEGRLAPIPSESEGVVIVRPCTEPTTLPRHEFRLDWGQYSPPATSPGQKEIARAWERLEALLNLVKRGKVQAYQYNIVLEQLGFSRFLRITSSDVLEAVATREF